MLIPLTASHTLLLIAVVRIWWYIKTISLSWRFSLSSTPFIQRWSTVIRGSCPPVTTPQGGNYWEPSSPSCSGVVNCLRRSRHGVRGGRTNQQIVSSTWFFIKRNGDAPLLNKFALGKPIELEEQNLPKWKPILEGKPVYLIQIKTLHSWERTVYAIVQQPTLPLFFVRIQTGVRGAGNYLLFRAWTRGTGRYAEGRVACSRLSVVGDKRKRVLPHFSLALTFFRSQLPRAWNRLGGGEKCGIEPRIRCFLMSNHRFVNYAA